MDADSHDLIEVRGARENNLADVSSTADPVAHGDTLTAQHPCPG